MRDGLDCTEQFTGGFQPVETREFCTLEGLKFLPASLDTDLPATFAPISEPGTGTVT